MLLVDDDQVFNFISTKVLQRIGFVEQIQSSGSGNEALEYLDNSFSGEQPVPDIIFLDINMPVMDGFCFIEAFNKRLDPRKDKVMIIIVSSSQDPGDLKRAQELGVTHYLTKPISEDAIRSILGLEVVHH